jgi:RNA polymerase sigma-70 factor (ECF subfamily)
MRTGVTLSLMKARELRATIKRAIAGSRSDIETLLRVNAKAILFHVRRMVGPEDAEDVAQKVALKVITHIGSLRSPHAFSVWLRQIIVRTCDSHLRELQSRNQHQSELDEDAPVIDTDVARMPELAFEMADERTRIYRYLNRLPQAQRESLVMFYYDEMSYREIAQILGVRVGTVSRNISNGKKNLELMLGEAGNKTTIADGTDTDPDTSTNTGNKLTAAMLGPAITESLNHQANLLFSPGDIERLISYCQPYLVAATQTATSTTGSSTWAKIANLTVSAAGKWVVLLLSVCLLASTVAVQLLPQKTLSVEPTETPVYEELYHPDVEIVFSGQPGDLNSSLNPLQARLILHGEDDRALDWVIADPSGAEHATGTGSSVDKELSALAAGEYTITWRVVNHYDIPASVTRGFFIE